MSGREERAQVADQNVIEVDSQLTPGVRMSMVTEEPLGIGKARVNDQYRIVFRFEGSDAFDVRADASR